MGLELVSRELLLLKARARALRPRAQARELQSQYGWYDDADVRQGGLIAFVRYFWDVLEPGRQLVDGWPLWAMCEHLEAVTAGRIKRLLINVPPGFMKSLLVDVFWPAWEWGPMRRLNYRYVAFSYSASLTERDNFRFRTLVAHPRYQRLYGPFKTSQKTGTDQFPESTQFDIDGGVTLINKTTITIKNGGSGWKFASSVGGVGTGERGDRIILDDPHNVKEQESDLVRGETVRWFRESMSNRLNDLATGAIVIIMQRVHEEDVSGVILSEGFGYVHLMIPWFSEVREASENTIGWRDPRVDEGEPAWPERFADADMAALRHAVGPYAWASQYAQSPAPRGGGIFERGWWQLWEHPQDKFPTLELVVASLDGAYTEREENDPCAMTVWGIFNLEEGYERTGVMGNKIFERKKKNRRVILLHAWSKHLRFSGPRIDYLPQETKEDYRRRTQSTWGLMEWVVDTCERFQVKQLLIEAKANGISAAQELQNRYGVRPWGVHLVKVSGDKVARALAVQPTFSQGLVYAPEARYPHRDWPDLVMDQMATFPKGKHDDLVDSTTQALKYLRDVGMLMTDHEVEHAAVERMAHRGPLKPLYPI